PKEQASSPLPEQNMNLTAGFGKLGMWALGKWGNLLDTGPLRRTMQERMKLDEAKIAASERTLLINTTQVSTGQNVIFSNRPIFRRSTNQPRPDVVPGITLSRILASCSIPMVYPWTRDAQTGGVYWDGALVANTPLGAALDAAADRPAEDVMEAVVVMMTPWHRGDEPAQELPLPKDLGEAITYALDWMLLSSFRESLALLEAFNRLAEVGRQMNDSLLSRYRTVSCTIVAPQQFFSAARILDYDARNAQHIEMGCQAAERAFLQAYPFQQG
ncbi:MAG TPA: patatin-like phospholipase family protein, partial [Anaerolineaceae bacterium]|nr:patatin-like phospholipase family protein [Anaerolineaceae bacterium]